MMKSPTKSLTALTVAVVLAAVVPVQGATIAPLEFDEVVRSADLVIEGTVVDLQNRYTGTDLAPADPKRHTAPASAGASLGPNMLQSLPPAPQSVGVEGGRMLFTEVTLSVQTEIVGTAGSTVTFRIAGGTDENGTVTVFGMPTFELGERYVVFLRPGHQADGVPIVGVNQGYFRIARRAGADDEVLLNANGDIVLGVEDGRLVARHNPDQTEPGPQLAPPPTPPPGSDVRARTSPQVARYWTSDEAPLTLDAFVDRIRAAKEVLP